jgi:hypothetical protein
MESLVTEWKRLHAEILQFEEDSHRNNILRAVKAMEDLKSFIDASIPTIDTWLHTYLATHRSEVFIRFWLQHGYDWMYTYMDQGIERDIYPEFTEQWSMVPKTVDVGQECIDTSFQVAKERVAEYHRRESIDHCDRQDILDMHKDKACESNGWFCWTCEDMEFAWEKHLKKNLEQSTNEQDYTNLFLTRKFHSAFLASVSIEVHHWTPPEKRFDPYRDYARSCLYTTDELIDNGIQSREIYSKDGKTPLQCMRDVIHMVKYKKEWRLESSMNTEFDIFLCFWGYLPMINHAIDLDMKRAIEIRAMLSS